MTARQVSLQDPDAPMNGEMNRIERSVVYPIPVLLVLAGALALILNPSIAPHHTLQPLNGQLHFTALAAATG